MLHDILEEAAFQNTTTSRQGCPKVAKKSAISFSSLLLSVSLFLLENTNHQLSPR